MRRSATLAADGIRPLRVLSSEPNNRPPSNPYIAQLFDAVNALPDTVLIPMSAGAVFRPFDALHVHWPEVLVRKRSRTRSSVAVLLFVVLLIRVKIGNKPVARTVHNLDAHAPLGPFRSWLLSRLFGARTAEIHLSAWTVAETPAETKVHIPHGHYRDWFARYETTERVRGRFVYFGLLRAYKGVPALVAAFQEQPGPEFSLHLAGAPDTATFHAALAAEVDRDDRISLDARFLPEDETAMIISAAELVVLPYDYVVNSGAALLALSLGRPVLLRDGPTARELRDEFGESWVHTFTGVLSGTDLTSALDRARTAPGDSEPDMAAREWPDAAVKHAKFFHALMVASRHHP